jgi:hypothetical protein
MTKVKHTTPDGIVTEYWRDVYDGCAYFYPCSQYSESKADRQFYKDIAYYREERYLMI